MDASATIRLLAAPSSKEKQEPTLTAADTTVVLLAEMSDEALMAQLSKGASEALAILFRRYGRRVWSIAYRAVRDGAEADDLVQDTFLLIHSESKGFDSAKGSARGWIFQIAQRRAISRHRYLSSRHFYSRVDLDDVVDALSDPRLAARESAESIEEMFGEASFRKAFEELTLNQRETLRLHFYEGCTLAEIAVKLGQSRGNIKHHYFRGLDRLRKQLFPGKLQGNGFAW